MGNELDIFGIISNELELKENGIETYSPLTLAYIGDAIYEIVIRSYVISKGDTQVNKHHKRTSNLVKAGAQASMIESLMEDLTEEEISVFKRGRNAKSVSMAKNASMSEYRRATGFEALMGYLYLSGQSKRMLELIKKGIENISAK